MLGRDSKLYKRLESNSKYKNVNVQKETLDGTNRSGGASRGKTASIYPRQHIDRLNKQLHPHGAWWMTREGLFAGEWVRGYSDQDDDSCVVHHCGSWRSLQAAVLRESSSLIPVYCSQPQGKALWVSCELCDPGHPPSSLQEGKFQSEVKQLYKQKGCCSNRKYQKWTVKEGSREVGLEGTWLLLDRLKNQI